MSNVPRVATLGPGQTYDRFRVERVRYAVGDEGHERDVIRHPGSVVIVPLVGPQQVCLIRNFRPSVGKYLLELPAGTLAPQEPPIDCAARELIEETGFHAEELAHVHSFYAAPGILDERMHLFTARGLRAGTPCREANELIENRILSWSEALDRIRQREIEDAKTIVGLLFVRALLQP